MRAQEQALTELQAQRAQLAGQLAELKTPAILEIHAREIGMLRPGEQGFVIDFVPPRSRAKTLRIDVVPTRAARAS